MHVSPVLSRWSQTRLGNPFWHLLWNSAHYGTEFVFSVGDLPSQPVPVVVLDGKLYGR